MSTEQKIIDTKLPLTWLMSTAGTLLIALCTVLWNVSSQSNKLDQLIQSNSKLEKRMDERDGRLDAVRDSINGINRSSDSLTLRVESLERQVRK